MKKKEIEIKIVDYFKKYIEKNIKITHDNYFNDLIKVPFTYIDYSSSISFNPDPIDFAIYSKEKGKVIQIEYPWRTKKGKLTYKTIKL